MRPGFESLARLLRPRAVLPKLNADEWDTLLSLAETEHVLPIVTATLRAHEHVLPRVIVQRLSALQRGAALAGFYWSFELKGLLSAFQSRGVRIVPLKGPSLAARLYGDASLRVSRDLDLLVSKPDLMNAEDVLRREGFSPGIPDDYHCSWFRNSCCVELHHNVANPLAYAFSADAAVLRAQPAEFLGQSCWNLTPEDELLYLCLHAVRHRFERLSLLVDLRLAFHKLGAKSDWSPRGEVRNLDPLIALGLAMARHLDPNTAFPHRLEVSSAHFEHLEAVAAHTWKNLVAAAPLPLDWSAMHRFFLEIELPGAARMSRRIRHARILAGRVIGPDLQFAASLGLHHRWQASMIRPLRIAKDRLRTSGRSIAASRRVAGLKSTVSSYPILPEISE